MSSIRLVLPRLAALAGGAPGGSRLARLLSRAEVSTLATAAWPSAAWPLFGTEAPAPGRAPVAALTRQLDLPGLESGGWLRADPVHLQPGLNDVALKDAAALMLAPAEATELVEALNRGLGGETPRLHVGQCPWRWYLALEAPVDFPAEAPGALAGGGLRSRLPRGAAALPWLRLAAECQMLLHTSEINETRRRRALPAVNGVWCWGGGEAPPLGRLPRWLAVGGGDPVIGALATQAGSPVLELPALLESGGDRLLVLATGESDVESLEGLEDRVLPGLEQALRRRHCRLLEVQTADRLFRLSAAGLFRLWRRPRPLRALLGTAAGAAPKP